MPIARALESPEFRNDFAAERFAARIRRELQDDGYGPAVYRWAGLLAHEASNMTMGMARMDGFMASWW